MERITISSSRVAVRNEVMASLSSEAENATRSRKAMGAVSWLRPRTSKFMNSSRSPVGSDDFNPS